MDANDAKGGWGSVSRQLATTMPVEANWFVDKSQERDEPLALREGVIRRLDSLFVLHTIAHRSGGKAKPHAAC